MEIGWNDQIRDFAYSASLNISHIKNKVLDLGYGQTVYNTTLAKTVIGEPLGMWYLYKMNGIFQSEEEIRNYVNSEGKIIQPNALPGDIKYDDYNGDGNISSEDRQVVGSPWPKLELGISLSASYKGFDLNINGYGPSDRKYGTVRHQQPVTLPITKITSTVLSPGHKSTRLTTVHVLYMETPATVEAIKTAGWKAVHSSA